MSLFESISGLLGAGASVVGNILGTSTGKYRQYKYQSKLQEQAAKLNYDYGQKALQNNASSTRQGLEKAGYNPMLAVQNATSGANAGWTTAGQAADADYGASISAGISNAQSFQRLKNETKTAEAQQDQAYALADKAKVEKNSLIEKLPYISKREKAEIANVEKDSLLKESQIHNIDETTRFIEKRYELDKLLGFAGIDVQRAGVGAAYANARAAQTSAEAKTLSQYAGKYFNDFIKRNKGHGIPIFANPFKFKFKKK